MEDNFGIKELYDVQIKAIFPIEIGNKTYEPGESIIRFNKIQVSTLTERKSRRSARGGYGNIRLIDWENTDEVSFILSEGIISKVGLALLSNSILTKSEENNGIVIPYSQILESNQEGVINTKFQPVNDNTLFIYNKDTGEKIKPVKIEENHIYIDENFTNVIVDYTFNYMNKSENYFIGKKLFNGYLKLEGKIRLRDDEDGHIKTGIIEMPKIKIMSDLKLRLGRDVSPYVYQFNIIGVPVGARNDRYVCKISILDTELPQDEE